MSNQEQVTTFRIKDFWTDAMKKIMAVQDRFEAKVKNLQTSAGKSFDSVKSKVEGFKIANMDAISDITSQIPGLGSLGPMLANPYVAGTAAALAFATAAVDATKYAQKWESKLAEANVTAKLSKSELQGVSEQLMNIGGRNVKDLMEVPDTFNNILSAGLSVDQTMQSLEPTLRAAKAGFTDSATAAAAGVGVMNSSGESIGRVFDVLFATVDKGSASFDDIAKYLPKIIPNARAAGLALDETAGAWAYLTSQGVKSESATTLMENAIKVLSTKDRISDFNKLGVAIFDQKGKMLPLIKIIEQLAGKMDGLTDKERINKLASLGMDQQAATAFNMMIQDTNKLQDAIDGTVNSAGAADQAYRDAAQSGDTWAIAANKMRVIWLQFGESFLPIVDKWGQWTLDTIDWFERMNKQSIIFQDSLSIIGDYFNWIWTVSTIPLEWIWNTFKNIGDIIGLTNNKLEDSGSSFEKMYLKARPYLIWIKETLGSVLDVVHKILTADFTGAFAAIKNFQLPDMAKIIQDQAKKVHENELEVGKKAMEKILDVSLPGSKSLTPGKANPYAGLDLNGMSSDGKRSKGGSKGGGVSGSAGGARNITINIQQLLPGMTVNATTIKEAASDIGRLIQEELIKMISDTTLAVE